MDFYKGKSEQWLEMYACAGSWEDYVPADLYPAIKHLRKSFGRSHFGCGWTTQKFCYALLHAQILEDPAQEYSDYLLHMKRLAGRFASKRFDDLLSVGTEPAIFIAFHDLYVAGTGVQMRLVFKEFLAIAIANAHRLDTSPLKWAQRQTSHLIRSHNHSISNWVKSVCDTSPYDPNEDADEQTFWRKWNAPSLIIMKPSRYRAYDANTVWERNDAEKSVSWLASFMESYVIKLESQLKNEVGLVTLANAKQPIASPVSEHAAEKNEVDQSEKSISGSQLKTSVRETLGSLRRKAKGLETEEARRLWRKEYCRLKKKYPERTDVWCSRQIAKLEIARGSNSETIRKNMKK
jgi:hypothetical protein